MSERKKLVLLLLLLLLTSVAIVAAQSSSSFIVERFVTDSGGLSQSASYTVHATIGQPATNVVSSASYGGSAGFLHPLRNLLGDDFQIWIPVLYK